MNKLFRNLQKIKKFKQRQKVLKFDDDNHVFKSTGKPCSCYMCSPYKFKRKIKHKYADTNK